MSRESDPTTASMRYHAFDALRAVMMLLGVVIHASQYYMTLSLMGGFRFQDRYPTPACDAILFGIHTFRMQVFFVMAGFFTALLYERRGPKAMMSNRLRRVGLPMLLSWPILYPLTISAVLYGCAMSEGVPPWEALIAWWTTGDMIWIPDWNRWFNVLFITPLHLWFLYALLWFYLLAFGVRFLWRLKGDALGRSMDRLYRNLMDSGLLLPSAIAMTLPTLLLTPIGMAAQEFPAFIPNPLVMLCYGPYFAFGWMTYRHRDLLPRFARRPWLCLAATVPLLSIFLSRLDAWILPIDVSPGVPAWLPESLERLNGLGILMIKLGVATISTAVAWLSVFGFLGLFLRHGDRPNPLVRYLSDSAYFVYLAHLPLVYWMQVAMYDLPMPGLVKASLVLVVASTLLLIAYDLLVRPTIIGQLLNGRRYPSVLLGMTRTSPSTTGTGKPQPKANEREPAAVMQG